MILICKVTDVVKYICSTMALLDFQRKLPFVINLVEWHPVI